MALIAERGAQFAFGPARVVVNDKAGTIVFDRCFRARGFRLDNPKMHVSEFDDVLAVHDFVAWNGTSDDGPRSSVIVTRQGSATIDEYFAGYWPMRAFLKELCADRIDRGSWSDDPNVTEPLTLGAMLLGFYLLLLFGFATV